MNYYQSTTEFLGSDGQSYRPALIISETRLNLLTEEEKANFVLYSEPSSPSAELPSDPDA